MWHDSFVHAFSCTAPAPPSLYTLSLHDALPILPFTAGATNSRAVTNMARSSKVIKPPSTPPKPTARLSRKLPRSEEHTSELQSRGHLVCRLLLEKKKKMTHTVHHTSREYVCSL